MNLAGVLVLAGLAWIVRRSQDRPASRRRNPEFYADFHGRGRRRQRVVHPIRGSTGWGGPYSVEVERIVAEQRREDAARRHWEPQRRDERSDVVRPPWAVGISDGELRKIARTYGQSASTEGWWEAAGLIGGGRDPITGRRLKASGELRYELEAGQHRTARARTVRSVRRRPASAPRWSSRRATELPW